MILCHEPSAVLHLNTNIAFKHSDVEHQHAASFAPGSSRMTLLQPYCPVPKSIHSANTILDLSIIFNNMGRDNVKIHIKLNGWVQKRVLFIQNLECGTKFKQRLAFILRTNEP